jgi:hypothetical protein
LENIETASTFIFCLYPVSLAVSFFQVNLLKIAISRSEPPAIASYCRHVFQEEKSFCDGVPLIINFFRR